MGLRQKVNIVSDDFAIAWAGDADVAAHILVRLRQEFRDASNLTLEEKTSRINEAFEATCGGAIPDVAMILWYRDVNRYAFAGAGRIDAEELEQLGPVWFAGSGAPAFLQLLTRIQHPVPDRWPDVLSNVLRLVGYAWRSEMTDQATLNQKFGGAFEVATIVDGRISKIDDVLYAYSDIEPRGNLSIGALMAKVDYIGDELIVRVLEVDNRNSEAIQSQIRATTVPPLDMDQVHEIELSAFEPRDMNAYHSVVMTDVWNANGSFAAALANVYQLPERLGPIAIEIGADGAVLKLQRSAWASIREEAEAWRAGG